MAKKLLLTALLCFSISVPSWAAEAPSAVSPEYLPGQVLVRVEEGLSQPQVEEIAKSVGAKVERRVASWGIYLLSFDQATPVSEVVKRLQDQPGVRYAEPNAKLQVNAIGGAGPSGTLTAAASSSIVVAVIDTGVYMPAFSGSIYTNTREIAGNGIDDDGNGYVDDVHGWDFADWDNNADGSVGAGAHGTEVTSCVLRGAGGVGVSILPLRVGPGPWLYLDAIVSAIDYAVAQGARVINMSFGASSPYQVLTEVIQHAAQKGVLLVAAAGNSGSILPSYPAAYPGVVSVAASNANGQKSWWSNYGGVTFTAPGENVTTTTWGGGTAVVSGTSFSSPFVAGVMARILAALPNLTPAQVIDKLRSFAKDVNALNNPFFRGLLGLGWVDDGVAKNVSDALPLDGSGTQPPQPDLTQKTKLQAELDKARQEVVRLQGEVLVAEQALSAAGQAVTAANAAAKQTDEKVNQAWKDLISSWRAWYQSYFGSTPAERAALGRKREEAWDNLFKAMVVRRETLAKLRTAQTEEVRARIRRNDLAGQLKLAQQRVQDLERRLAQLSVPAHGQVQSSAHRSEVEQLLQKLHAITDSLGRSSLPEGLSAQEVPDLVVSGSDDRRSSN